MQQEVIDWCDKFSYPIEEVTPVLEKTIALIRNIMAMAAGMMEHAKNAPKTIPIGKNTRYGKYQKMKSDIWSAKVALLCAMAAIKQAQIISQPIPKYSHE